LILVIEPGSRAKEAHGSLSPSDLGLLSACFPPAFPCVRRVVYAMSCLPGVAFRTSPRRPTNHDTRREDEALPARQEQSSILPGARRRT
jgi:hypothetical protein